MGADTHFNVTNDGIAIGGYDVVAYFVSGKPHRGTAAYSVIWEGAEWHFTNDENVVRTAWSAGPTNAGRRLAKRS